MSRWLPTRWWRPEGARSWRPGDQRRAAWGRHRPRQRCREGRRNPEANRSSESRSLLTLDRKRFSSLLWECQHWLRGPVNCHKPLRRYRPPPSDCSRCTCPGWTYWTIKQSSTLIYLKGTLCSGLKDPQRKLMAKLEFASLMFDQFYMYIMHLWRTHFYHENEALSVDGSTWHLRWRGRFHYKRTWWSGPAASTLATGASHPGPATHKHRKTYRPFHRRIKNNDATSFYNSLGLII